MTAPVSRPSPFRRIRENRQRIRAIEQVPRLGMGVELNVATADFDGSDTFINNWEIANDPHGYYEGGSLNPTRITVPEGLGGIYIVSFTWQTSAE